MVSSSSSSGPHGGATAVAATIDRSRCDGAVVIALGSNLAGDYASSEALLEAALVSLAAEEFEILACSSWWGSLAWPCAADPPFVNGVALAEPNLGPDALFARLRTVERAFGRRRGPANGPRTLDLDLIAYGRVIKGGPELILPHPRASERKFVMGPLAEIAPDWSHPASGDSAADLAWRAPVGRDAQPLTMRGHVAQRSIKRYL